jgi:hypothetical protein
VRRRAELLLVGSHMPEEVVTLAASDIVPVGDVPSIDEILGKVRLTIAPMRYGAGLKGKVLDSMAEMQYRHTAKQVKAYVAATYSPNASIHGWPAPRPKLRPLLLRGGLTRPAIP